MAVGLPLKTTYANGDVFSASDINDTNGTINLIGYGAPYVSGKNAIINGGMDIWQRGTSFVPTASSYTVDRWQAIRSVSGSTVSRQSVSDTTNLPTIQYCTRVSRDSGDTSTSVISFAQSIESTNSYRMAGQSVVVSFYARKGANYSAASSVLAYALYSGTGTDQNVLSGYTGSATTLSGNATLTTTWQRFTATATVAATATELGLSFTFTPVGTAGAADYFEITGVQLEQGSAATTFSRSGGSITGELQNCQRYLPAFQNGNFFNGFNNLTTRSFFTVKFPTTARKAATGITTPGASNFTLFNASTVGGTATAITYDNSGTESADIYLDNTAGSPTMTVGYGALMRIGASGYILFTGCEL